MAISRFPAPAAPSGLNAGEVFTSSGTWTVPAGVTYVYVTLRGGNGTPAAFIGSGLNNASTVGTAGGNTSAFSITANGGLEGANFRGAVSRDSATSQGRGPGDGVTIMAIVSVTPDNTETITVGSGIGSYVSIMWSES